MPTEAGDDTVGGASVFDLDHRALARPVGRIQTLGHDTVESGTLEAMEPVFRHGAVACGRGEVDGPPRTPEQLLKLFAPHGERHVAHVLVTPCQQVPDDEGSWHLRGEKLHTRGSRMDA